MNYYPTTSSYDRFCDDFFKETGHYYNGEPITAAQARELMKALKAEEERKMELARRMREEQKEKLLWKLPDYQRPRCRFHLLVGVCDG